MPNRQAQQPSGIERRQNKRFAIRCGAAVLASPGQAAIKVRTINVSDGGALLEVPVASVPPQACPGESIEVTLSVPRSTANTYMVEQLASPARVIRHEMLNDNSLVGLALQFLRPLELGIEV